VLQRKAICIGMLAILAHAPNTNAESPLGRKIDAFELADFRGKQHALADYGEAKLVVVAFLGTECPLVKLYAKRLQAMSERYSAQGVAFLGINSNQQDSLTEIEHFARTHGVRFPLLKDPGNRVADLFGAERTPEVFVLDAKRVVRYHGRIDDQYTYETQRPEKQKDYLSAAVGELLDGKPVSVAETEVVGCHIGRKFTKSEDKGTTARPNSLLTQAPRVAQILAAGTYHGCPVCMESCWQWILPFLKRVPRKPALTSRPP
jgi:peroxiredoxin